MVIMLNPLYMHLDIGCVITRAKLGCIHLRSCSLLSMCLLLSWSMKDFCDDSLKNFVHSYAYVWKDNSRFQLLSALQHSLETREGSCRSAS